jgi:hypothetical protein
MSSSAPAGSGDERASTPVSEDDLLSQLLPDAALTFDGLPEGDGTAGMEGMFAAFDGGGDEEAEEQSTTTVGAELGMESEEESDGANGLRTASGAGAVAAPTEATAPIAAMRRRSRSSVAAGVCYSQAYLLDRETEAAMVEKFIRRRIVEGLIVAGAAAEAERMSGLDEETRRELAEMRRLGLATHFDSSSHPLKTPAAAAAAAAGAAGAQAGGRSSQRRREVARGTVSAATGRKSGAGGASVRQRGDVDADDADRPCPAVAVGTVCEACFGGDGLWCVCAAAAAAAASAARRW